MQILRSVLHAIDFLSEWSGKSVSFLILFMIGLLVCDVALRNLFTHSIIWVPMMVQFMFGGLSILVGAYVLRHREHVNMDLVYARLTPRKKAYFDVATSIFFFLFCGMILWYGYDFAVKAVVRWEQTLAGGKLILWPVKITIPVAAFLILLQGIAKFIRDLFLAVTGRELK